MTSSLKLIKTPLKSDQNFLFNLESNIGKYFFQRVENGAIYVDLGFATEKKWCKSIYIYVGGVGWRGDQGVTSPQGGY